MNPNFSAGTIWRVRLARAGGDLAIDRMGELLDEVPRREAKQVRGKVVSLGTLLFRAPKSPAPLGFRQPSKSPQHVFIVSRAIPSSNESPARKPSRPHWHAISKGVCWRMRSWRAGACGRMTEARKGQINFRLKCGNSRTTFVTPKLVEAKTGAPEQSPKQYPSRSM